MPSAPTPVDKTTYRQNVLATQSAQVDCFFTCPNNICMVHVIKRLIYFWWANFILIVTFLWFTGAPHTLLSKNYTQYFNVDCLSWPDNGIYWQYSEYSKDIDNSIEFNLWTRLCSTAEQFRAIPPKLLLAKTVHSGLDRKSRKSKQSWNYVDDVEVLSRLDELESVLLKY